MNPGHSQQTAILVFGMHRSGTSATTRVLNLLGAELGEQVIEPQFDNPKGFWESAEAVDIHDRLLGALSRNWSDVRRLPAGWIDLPVARSALDQLVSLIKRNFSGKALWVVKDPRMCLLAPLWLEALENLGIQAKALFVVRNPWEVAESLRVRNHLGHGHASMMWIQHLLEPELATRSTPRFMVTFDQVLHDWRATMLRVAEALQIAWPHTLEGVAAEVELFLDKGERHHSGEVTPDSSASLLPAVVLDAYKECLGVAEAGNDWQALRSLSDEFVAATSQRMTDLLEAALDDVAQSNLELEQRLHALGLQLQSCEQKSVDFESLLGGVYRSLEELSPENAGSVESEPPFYAEYYQAKYPDVAAVGYGALEHFEIHGKDEGRMGAPPIAKRTSKVEQTVQALAQLASASGQLFPSITQRMGEAARENEDRLRVMNARIQSLTREIDSCARQREESDRQARESVNLFHAAESRVRDLERGLQERETAEHEAHRVLGEAEARIKAGEMALESTRAQLDESNERLRAAVAQQQEQLISLRFLGLRLLTVVRQRLFGR